MREGLSVVVNDGLYILYFFFLHHLNNFCPPAPPTPAFIVWVNNGSIPQDEASEICQEGMSNDEKLNTWCTVGEMN